MTVRKASVKETGEEVPSREWERFDAAVAELKAERARDEKLDAPAEQNVIVERDNPSST